jgi:hypothetical protein
MTMRLGMDAGASNWIKKTIRLHLWRVECHHGPDDLMQDGCLLYYQTKRRYPNVSNQRHLMRLFQRTFINHIHKLSYNRTRQRRVHECLALTDPSYQDAFLTTLAIGRAPPSINALLDVLSTAKGRRALRRPYYARKNGTRQPSNDRIVRLTKIEMDYKARVRSHFGI